MLKINKIGENINLISLGQPDSNVYLVNNDTLIDSSSGLHPEMLKKGLGKLGVAPGDIKRIISTYHHIEHMGGNVIFPHAKKMMHKKTADMWNEKNDIKTHAIMFPNKINKMNCDVLLEHNHSLNIGDSLLKVIQSPDNEDGHICLFDQKNGFLFSGDTEKELIEAMDLDIKLVLPAHGEPYRIEKN